MLRRWYLKERLIQWFVDFEHNRIIPPDSGKRQTAVAYEPVILLDTPP